MHARYVKAFPYTAKQCASLTRRVAALIHRIASLIHGIASLIMKFMIQAWQITQTQNIKLELEASSLDDVTRQLPNGYYSTFRTFDGCTRVLGLTAHLGRLYEPVIANEVSESFLRRQLLTLLEPYRPAEARIRVTMTKQGQVYIAIEPLRSLSREVYENGVHVETTELHRDHPQLKSTSFIMASASERKHIAQEGIFEALLVKNRKILEGMTSNFFYVKHDILFTAEEDILLGITRQTVIEVARGRGVEVEYEPLARNHLTDVDEAFITSSSRGIVPVVQIDEVAIGQGRPGPITVGLSVGYDQYVIENAEKI
jgi:branched-chain amino acid aminotransferase